MGFWILPVLGISLGLTIIFELVFALVFKVRNRKDLLLLIMVNIITNPPVVFTYYILHFYTVWNDTLIKIPLEIMAVLVEAYYYKNYGKDYKRPLLFSFFANLFSFGLGIIINVLL